MLGNFQQSKLRIEVEADRQLSAIACLKLLNYVNGCGLRAYPLIYLIP